jgi:hypothetical protein
VDNTAGNRESKDETLTGHLPWLGDSEESSFRRHALDTDIWQDEHYERTAI